MWFGLTMSHHHLHFTNYGRGTWSAHAAAGTKQTPITQQPGLSMPQDTLLSSSHLTERRLYHHHHSWWRTMCHLVGCFRARRSCNSQARWQLLIEVCWIFAIQLFLAVLSSFHRQPHKAAIFFSYQLQHKPFPLPSNTTVSLLPKHYLPGSLLEVTFLTWRNIRKRRTAVRLECIMNQK